MQDYKSKDCITFTRIKYFTLIYYFVNLIPSAAPLSDFLTKSRPHHYPNPTTNFEDRPRVAAAAASRSQTVFEIYTPCLQPIICTFFPRSLSTGLLQLRLRLLRRELHYLMAISFSSKSATANKTIMVHSAT